MTVMSGIEAKFCRSAPWRGFARRVVLPWALRDTQLCGHGLELGGGSGAMAYELLQRQPDVRLTVADLDPAMVGAANRRLAQFGDRASVVLGDAASLPFESGKFDFVCSWLMLHHTIEWEGVVAEAARVLRPGGCLVGYDQTDSAPARLVHRVDRSAHRLVSPDQFDSALDGTNFSSVSVQPAIGGLVMRFAATLAP